MTPGGVRRMQEGIVPDFDKLSGLVPAVVQDEHTREVLMVACRARATRSAP